MQKIRKIAVLGAGAMGAYFAGRFFDTPGFSTTFIAKGDRLKKLKTRGLVVNGTSMAIPVVHPDNATGPVDLVIVALKNHHLEQAARGLDKLISDSTLIISVMNGLDSEHYMGALYGMDKVLYTISVAIDAARRDNQIFYTNPGKHYFGNAANIDLSPQVLRVQEAFDRAGIVYETPEDMIRMLWWKFMINVGVNQASAAMQAPFGVFQTSPEARGMMEALMKEVISVAKAMDVNLTDQDIDAWYAFLNTLPPGGKTSMLQDIEAGRKTEIEIFGEKVVELGRTHQIATPVNQTVSQIIRVLEQGRDRSLHQDQP